MSAAFGKQVKEAVASKDLEKLEASMAGFALTKENGAPNIVFGVRDGVLAVSGINYEK